MIKAVNFISVFLKSDLKNNCEELSSIYNEGKSIVAERFIRTLKNKIYKQMTAVSKMFTSMFWIILLINTTTHFIELLKWNLQILKLILILTLIIDHVGTSKDKNIFAKGYTPNWSEEVFLMSKIKKTVRWLYGISDLNGEEIVGTFYEKELQKTNQEEFWIEKVIKRKQTICQMERLW